MQITWPFWPAFTAHLLLTYVLPCFSSSVLLKSRLTVFRGKRAQHFFFFSNQPHTLPPPVLLASLAVCSACTIVMCPLALLVLLVVSRKLMEMTGFFNKRLHTCRAVDYCPLEFKAGWAFLQYKMSFLLRQKTWHYFPLPPHSVQWVYN